jgi:hypothetical protein
VQLLAGQVADIEARAAAAAAKEATAAQILEAAKVAEADAAKHQKETRKWVAVAAAALGF